MEEVAKTQHLLKRNGRYYFRVRVPDDVVAHLGKEFIQHSLKTSDRKQAIEKVNLERVKADELFRKARTEIKQRAKSDNQTIQVSKTQIERIIKLWFIVKDEKRATLDVNDSERLTPYELADRLADLGEELAVLHNEDEHGRRQEWAAHEVDEILKKEGITLQKTRPATKAEREEGVTEKETDEYTYFKSLYLKAMRELLLKSEERLTSKQREVKTHDAFFAASAGANHLSATSAASSLQVIAFGDVAKEFKSDPIRNLTEKSRMDEEYKLNMLCEIIGADTPLQQITGKTAHHVIGVLKQLPSNAEKYFPNLSYQQKIQKGAERGLPTLSDPTINKFMEKLSGIFKFAISMGYIPANTVEGVRLTISAQHKATARLPFTIDQLNWIFRHYMHWGWRNGNGNLTPPLDCLWIPIISLFTGTRRAEVCQLLITDIRVKDDIEFFRIETTDDEDEQKSVKTSAGFRNIPIHPRLKELGFMEYYKAMQKTGKKRLFPNIPRGDGKKETYKRFGDWFSRNKKKLEVEKVAFHSLRHNFQDELKNNGVDAQMQYWLCGWNDAGSSMATNYGSEPKMKTKLQAIEKVVYEGLDLSAVEPLLYAAIHMGKAAP